VYGMVQYYGSASLMDGAGKEVPNISSI
jgi:hypothetical protein